VVVVAAIAAVFPLAAGSSPAVAQASVPGKGTSISPRLAELAERADRGASTNRADNLAVDVAPDGPGSLLRNAGDLVVNVRFAAAVTPLDESRLRAAGARIVSTLPSEGLVSIAIPASAVDAVAAVRGVAWMEEVLEPRVGRSGATLDRSGLARALQDGGATTSATCAPIISEGDTQLAAATARSTFGVDGSGVIVGVLSDSYNNLSGAAADVAAGELPGAGNPCGRTTPVQVQSDLASGGTDEGRAMAQVIHDLAPGATIRVATAFNGDVDFANQIRALATAGAKVIVDDITYFNEAMYQDGIIAKAILDVTAQGVTYFSSAGNQNLRPSGVDIAGYEAPAFRSTTCPAAFGAQPYTCHDWDPGAGTDALNAISVAPGATIQIRLGWNQPQFGITTDFDGVLLNAAGTSVLAASAADNLVGQTAAEIVSYTNSTGSTVTAALAIGRYDSPGTPRFRFVFQRYSGAVSWEWSTPGAGDTVGPVAIGHNMMRNTGSTAAIRYDTTSAPEAFSSRGPATYCWNPVSGTTAASALPGCVAVNPTLTATNGGANSFFGQLVSGVWRFFGTSQAAPHAAAIAALQVQARPCRTPAQILAAQQASAVAIGGFGASAIGAGRVQAPGSISNLATCLPGAPTGVTGTPGNGQVSLSWTAPAPNGGSPVTGYRVTPVIGASAQTPVTFASTATAQTITGLTNGTAYTFRVAALSASGAGADSTASAAITPRTVPGAPTGVSGTPGNGQVTLSWTAPASNGGSAVTGYRVTPFVGASAQTPVVFNSTATTQTVTGLVNLTAYTFRVAAINAAGTGADSNPSSLIVPAGSSTVPTGVVGTPGDGTVALTWSAPTVGGPFQSYVITIFQGSTSLGSVETFDASTSAEIGDLANGTAYTFEVAARSAGGVGSPSARSAAVTPRGVPGSPTGLAVTPGNGQVTASWTAPGSNGSPITGYQVLVLDGEGDPVADVSFDASTTTRTVVGLTNGAPVVVAVRAVNVAGPGSYAVAPAAVTPRTVPGTPTGVTGASGDGQVTLSWFAPASNGGSAVTGYRVTPFVGATAQAPVTFSSTATTQTITGLTNGTGYSFRVAAINVAGTGADSVPSATVTPSLPGAPFAPFSSWSALVTRIYTDLIGVAPSTSARNAYVSRLSGGSLTIGGFVAELRGSTDNVGNVDPVTRLYRAYFLRIPDRGGLTFWIRQRRVNGRTLNAISDSFASSSEFRNKYGSLSNRQFVELVYLNVLGRPGERSGVDFWTSRLDRRVSTRGQVMTGFSESNEYKRKQVAEVDVSVLYILLMGRAPTTSEFNALVTALEAPTTTIDQVAAQLIASPEYATRVS
jgi:titin